MKNKFIRIMVIILFYFFLLFNVERNEEKSKEHILNLGLDSYICKKEVSISNSRNKEKEKYEGYAITTINVRNSHTTDSDIVGLIYFNEMITYSYYSEKWLEIEYNGSKAYVYKDYISDNDCDYKSYTNLPVIYNKTYMSYKAITSKSSKQYKLKQYTYNGNYGIRMIDNRYCIAMGTGFNIKVGDYVDLVLANDTIIQCIIGDIKDNSHTDSSNMVTVNSKCMSEFIVTSKKSLPSIVGDSKYGSGDISDCCEEWKSSISKVIVYDKNYFD